MKMNKLSLKRQVLSVLWAIIRLIIILGLCYIIIYPFFIKIANAFKTSADFLDPTVRFIPRNFTFDNITVVSQKLDYFSTLGNTLLVSGICGVLCTFVSSSVGYGLARFNFKGKNLLFVLMILTLVIPPQTVIIPLFLRFKSFFGIANLLGTPLPVFILAATGLSLKNGLYIFMFRQFYRNVPKALEEAAYLDGCGNVSTYINIMLPAAKTMIATIFLLSFSWTWTDTVYNRIFLQDYKILANVISLASVGIDSKVMGANYVGIAALLAVLPLVVVYIFAQRSFVQSIENSGLVG